MSRSRDFRSRAGGHASRFVLIGACALLALALGPNRPTAAQAVTARGPTGFWHSWSLRPTEPRPSVARVSAVEGNTVSQGSGALIGVQDRFGLVITNWHVVKDATGPVHITFPDGFQSAATVLKTDADWDLAALLIWRPRALPLSLASHVPQPGEWLTIAGYGSGSYREAHGPCTQYVAPGRNMPYDMIEVRTTARQGDSGGPILNEQGELAGVLFGSGGGTTAGSHCDRVRWFLQDVWGRELSNSAAPSTLTAQDVNSLDNADQLPSDEPSSNAPAVVRDFSQRTDDWRHDPTTDTAEIPVASDNQFAVRDSPQLDPPRSPTQTTEDPLVDWDQLVGRTVPERAKSFLALIGIVALWRYWTDSTRQEKKKAT